MVDSPDNTGPVMPPAQAGASAVQGLAAPDSAPLPPPSYGRQIAQLVLIPAAIVIACLAAAAIFGGLVGQPDNIEDQLSRLRQTGGMYKDRCLAAYNVATMIPAVKPAERKELSDDLIKILETSIHEDDGQLQYFVILALGRLGQEGGLEPALKRAESKHEMVRVAVIGTLLYWSQIDMDQARRGLGALTKMLADPREPVRSQAAAAMSKLARPTDADAIVALHEAMASTGLDYREGTDNPNDPPRQFTHARWNAAVALAVLGDEKGAAFVADILLNRDELAKLHGDITGRDAATLSPAEQDKVIARVLQQAAGMKDPRIWQRIKAMATDDPSMVIRKAASQLLQQRGDGGIKG